MRAARRAAPASAPDPRRLHGACAKREAFPRSHRLLTSADFRQVFRQRRKVATRHASLHLSRNGRDHARLGITVSRKVSKKAVQRNRIKRLVREYFRKHNVTLTGTDVVFTAFPGCADLTNEALVGTLDRLWRRAQDRCAR